jgi:hypothetical protein
MEDNPKGLVISNNGVQRSFKPKLKSTKDVKVENVMKTGDFLNLFWVTQ